MATGTLAVAFQPSEMLSPAGHFFFPFFPFSFPTAPALTCKHGGLPEQPGLPAAGGPHQQGMVCGLALAVACQVGGQGAALRLEGRQGGLVGG